jgi:AraC-like DNA-binding protein
MALRHLESPQATEATLQVFLSAHLVSAFDLSGTLQVAQLEPIEEIIRQEVQRLSPDGFLGKDAMLSAISRILTRIQAACSLSPGHGAGKMEAVRVYIQEHYADPNLSVSSLADEFSCSISYLSRAFKQVTGVRPNEYIHALRIRRARHLLRTTSLPIHRIATLVGFASSSVFIRAYRTAEGITPGAYRQRAHRLEGESD